jgi:hypothetical protein
MKTRIHYDSARYDETFRVGVEIEACLLDDNGIPVNANPLIKELEGTKLFCFFYCFIDFV